MSYSVFDHLQRVSHAAIIENKRLGEVLAWIKQQQDKQPHHRGDLVGPRRSNQKASLMKDGVDRLAQGKNQAVGPPPGAVAAPIVASTQRRLRLLQKLPNDILTLQSKRHLNLVATPPGSEAQRNSTTSIHLMSGARAKPMSVLGGRAEDICSC